MDDLVLYEKEGAVGKVILNKPQHGNTLDLNMLESLIGAFKQSDENEDLCVLYTAEGKNFTFGADLKYAYGLQTKSGGLEESVRYMASFQDLTRVMRKHRGILIAGLKGLVIGGGFEISLSCDLRIAAKDMKIKFPELSIGTMFSNATTKLLPRIIGEGRTKELLFMARSINAEEALVMGLVNHVCDPDALMDVLNQVANELLEKEPYALSIAKRLINENQDIDLESTLEKELTAMINCGFSKGFKARLKAFAEKYK